LKNHKRIDQKAVFFGCLENALSLFSGINITNHLTEEWGIRPEHPSKNRKKDKDNN
jgi:hypothetical protein